MNEIVRTPEVIAAEINVIKAQTREVVCRNAIEIGRRLHEAKCSVPHGCWGDWLAENVDYSERTAQDLMAMYDTYGKSGNPQAIADLSYTQAVILMRLDYERRAELLESGEVAEMSTRELEAEVKRLNAEREKQQVTLAELMGEAEKHADELETERKAAQGLRESLSVARANAAAAESRASDAVQRANEVARENVRIAAELEAERQKPAPAPVIEQIEVIPPDIERELEILRAKADKQEVNECEVLLRDGYRQLVAQFEAVSRMIGELAEQKPEAAEKYARAVVKAARMMADKVETGV